MLFWLEEENAKRSVWNEISVEYWLHKGKKVLGNVKQWSKGNDALRAYDKANNSYNDRWGRTGQGTDLVARLEKGLRSTGKGLGEQGTMKYRS